MAYSNGLLAVLLAASPVLADEMEFQGHVIEAQGVADARLALRVRGLRYAIPGSPEQVVGKAQACLTRRDSGAGVVSVDAAGGRLIAVSRVEYRSDPLPGTIKGRLVVEAAGGGFSVVLSNLGVMQGPTADGADEVFAPLLLRGDSGWEAALSAVIGVKQALVDCMFS